MAKNKSITLGNHFDHFVDDQVNDGRFSNASEVVRAGLRLLEDEESKQRALRAALDEGMASGDAVEFDSDEFIKRKHKQHTSS
jgi:antitoxin ParD1/3/4